MSSGDESKTEMKELMDKFNKYAKQVKLVLAKLEEIDKKVGQNYYYLDNDKRGYLRHEL